MRIQQLVLVPFIPALLLSPALTATTLMRMSVEKISRTAEVIVRARCVENSTGWDAGEIWTFTSFDTEDAWRGSAPARITVRLLGGTYGNLTSIVAGVPRFQPGEEVILFLERTARGDFSIVSWVQGTFRIRRDARGGEARVTRDTASFSTFDPATRKFEATGVRSTPVSAFRARVDAALRGQAGESQ